MVRQINPAEMVDMANFIQALRKVASAHAEPVCSMVGGSLAHVGIKFGDQGRLPPALLDQVAREDEAFLAAVARMDAEGFFRVTAEHQGRWRICGSSPTYMLFSTLPATAGTVLKYGQAVELAAQSMVPYASVVFH
jgi:MEMO1 family protein